MTELLSLFKENKITDNTTKRVLEKLIERPFSPLEYVKKEKLLIISSKSDLERMCKEVIKNNPQPVQDLKSGKTEAIHFLVGQVMRLTKGKADPKIVEKLIKKLI